MNNEELLAAWRNDVIAHSERLDGEADKGGHDWHSLWAGFVIGKGRPDLTDWHDYMRLGFPEEGEE